MKNEIKPYMAQEKGNRLIAEFMGWKEMSHTKSKNWMLSEVIDGMTCAKRECSLSQMKFYSSWDWLMPVIEKISKLNLPDSDGSSENWQPFPRTFGMTNDDNGYFMFRFNRYFLHEAPVLIDAAYEAVVDFIKWYNDQLKGDSNHG